MQITFRLPAALLALLLLPPAALAQVPQLLNYQGRIAVNGTNFTGTGQFKFALVDGGLNAAHTAAGAATISGGFLTIVTVTDGGAGYASAPGVSATGGGGFGAVLTAQISGGIVTNVIVNSPGSGYTSQPGIVFAAPGSNVVIRTLWSNNGTSTNGSQPTASVGLPVTKGLYSVLLGDTTLANMAALPATVFTNGAVSLRVWFNDGVSGFQQLSPDQRLAAVGYAIMAGTVPDGSITTSKIAPGAVGTAQLAPGVGGLLSTQIPSTTNIQTTANSFYILTNGSSASGLTLPANPAVGDRVRLTANSGGFTIIANSGQSIMNPPSFLCPPRGPLGQNWSSVASSSDGSKLVAAADYIYTSTNYGMTWVQQTNAGSGWWNSVASSSDGSKLVAAADYIYTSTNYGVTWVQQTNAGSRGWFCVASSSDGSKLVAAGDYIYTSSNYGVTWTQQTNAGGLVASSSDGSKLVAAADYIYTSSNYGVTWVQQTNAGSGWWNSVASSSDGSKLVAGTYGDYIYTSSNYGVTWVQQTNAGSRNWSSVASSSDGSKLVAVAGVDYIYTSTNCGVTWMQQTSAGSQYWSSVASNSDGSKVLAAAVPMGEPAVGGGLYTLPNYITQWSTVYVSGDAYANIELVYAGGGLWVPCSYSGSFTIQ